MPKPATDESDLSLDELIAEPEAVGPVEIDITADVVSLGRAAAKASFATGDMLVTCIDVWIRDLYRMVKELKGESHEQRVNPDTLKELPPLRARVVQAKAVRRKWKREGLLGEAVAIKRDRRKIYALNPFPKRQEKS